MNKDQWSGYQNSIPLDISDLYGLLKNWPVLERDIKRAQLMISLWERKKRKAKTAMDIIYRTCAIRAIGPKYATLVNLYPYKTKNDKPKFKVTCLIKAYETWGKELFMTGDLSSVLNGYEMQELRLYAQKLSDQNGIVIEPLPIATKEEDEDLGEDEEVSLSEELPLPSSGVCAGENDGAGNRGLQQMSLSQSSSVEEEDEDEDDDFIDDDDDEDYEEQFSQKQSQQRGKRREKTDKTVAVCSQKQLGRAVRAKKPP